MSIATTLGRALDALIADTGPLAGFQKLRPASGQDMRRYFAKTEFSQREVVFYRDKWWTAAGGTVRVEASVLIPAVQMALVGAPQSLAAPDYAVPFSHFQYTTAVGAAPSWQVGAGSPDSAGGVALPPADCGLPAPSVVSWLESAALPWMRSLDAMDGVLRQMEASGQHQRLARLHAALGDRAAARASLVRWLRGLPRQADRGLGELAAAGLLSAEDVGRLRIASLQREDAYAAEVEAWLGG